MRITYLLLSSLLIAGASTTAFAQDASNASSTPTADAAPTATPTPTADAAPFTWSGAYLGLNVGDAFDSRTRFDRTTGFQANNVTALTDGLRPLAHSTKAHGVTAGGQIGLNYQLGQFNDQGLAMVAGAEADLAYTDLNRTDTLSNTTFFGPLALHRQPNIRASTSITPNWITWAPCAAGWASPPRACMLTAPPALPMAG